MMLGLRIELRSSERGSGGERNDGDDGKVGTSLYHTLVA